MTGRTPRMRPHRFGAALAALLLAGSTAACYTYSGARYGGPDAPLQARVAHSFGEDSFQSFAVSDRAHVAVFRVHGSGYARAIYPYHPGASSVFTPGEHTIATSTPSYVHGWRLASRFATGRSGHPACSGGPGHVSMSYLMIVASRQPLRLERLRDQVPFRYRHVSVVGTHFFGVSAFGTMDRLLARLVPEGLPREDWDVDWTVATDVGWGWCRRLRPPLLRRIASRPDPQGDDTTRADTRPRRLDGGDVPFDPPRIPIDLPEVASMDGGDGSGGTRVRVPLPPVDVTPVPRVTPGEEREAPPPGDVDDLERDRRPGRAGERGERRARDVGRRSKSGPSEHFGRLFDADDRREASGWIPGLSGDHGRSVDRRVRQWTRQLTKWANDPESHDFPDPPQPPARWRGGGDWRPDRPAFRRPPARFEGQGDDGDARRIDPPTRPNRGGDIEVRRPSTADHGGDSSARKDGGGSDDDRGGH